MNFILYLGVFVALPFLILPSKLVTPNVVGAYEFMARALSSSDPVRTSKDFIFMFLAVLICVNAKKTNNLQKIDTLAVTLFIILALVNVPDFLYINVFYQSIMFLVGIVFYITTYQQLNKSIIQNICWLISISGAIASFVVIFEKFGFNYGDFYAQMLGLKKVITNDYHKMVGHLGQVSLSTSYIALCTPAVLYLRKYFLLPLYAYAIFTLGGAIGGATFIAIILYFYTSKYINSILIYIVTSFLMVTFTITGLNGLDTRRFDVWIESLENINISLIGNGLGYFSVFFPTAENLQKYGEVLRNPHNEFLSALFSFGVIGAICFLAIFIISKPKSRAIGCGLFGVFVNCYGNFVFHLSSIAPIALFYIAVSRWESKHD